MIDGTGSRRRRTLFSIYSGSSIALCLALPGVAHAACAPDPTPANGTVTCSGADTDGLTINSNNTTVNVQQSATVSSMTAITPGSSAPYTSATNAITINDSGSITGGLRVESGAAAGNNGFAPNTYVTLAVGASGSIGGATAITLVSDAPTPGIGGIASITIDNSGSIRSSSGPAINSTTPINAGISSLKNETTGTIGAIVAPLSTLDNQGRIDGGSASAISVVLPVGSYTLFSSNQWTNSGTIASSGDAATIILQTPSLPVMVNSGMIANSGAGTAIAYLQPNAFSSTSLSNSATGTISSAAGTAISTTGALSLTNAGTVSGSGNAISVASGLSLVNSGTINGSVLANDNNGSIYPASSTINLSGGGKINGNLTLGAGNDTVIVDYVAGSSGLSGISGAVDAGGGTNQLAYNVADSTTIDSPLSLPATFSNVGLNIAAAGTVTLDTGFSTPGPIALTSSGSATLINKASFTVNGSALTEGIYTGLVTLDNRGSITSNFSSSSGTAIILNQSNITNSGTITANGGNGVSQSAGFGQFNNSGTISASGTAVNIFDGGLTNSGTITSTGGTAVYLTGNTGLTASNSGTISGATTGVSLFGYIFTNTGTISTTSGLAVALNYDSSLINQAGGVVSGDVGAPAGNANFGSSVSNAGTINGNVNFGTSFPFATGNTFIALDGGIVNGNLVLGSGGDAFVTSLTNTGPGLYAGVTGTVTGGPNEKLIYRVDADTTTTLATPGGVFSTVGYDLANNAKLTLSSSTTSSQTQSFTGAGSVNLTANLTGNGAQPLINLTGASPRSTVPNAIALTSNGTLTVTNTNANSYSNTLVSAINSTSSFTNTGTISVNDTSGRQSYYGPLIALNDLGGAITNTGTITLGGVTGIAASSNTYPTVALATITNSGTISQIAGAADAIGVSGTFALTNTGTISTGGTAVQFLAGYSSGSSSVTNSGTISSSHGPAITDNSGQSYYPYGPAIQVINQAAGTISGGTGQPAISLGIGVVDNAGTINGNVQLGPVSSTPYFTPTGSTYIARGGTLNGNLTFGAGDDTLIVIGNSTGVTGKIDAGSGTNTYAQGYTSSATIDATQQTLPTSFQKYAVGALGSGTTLTVTGPAAGVSSPLAFFGDGTIDLKTNVNAAPSSQSGANRVVLGQQNAALGLTGGLTFINEATLADGVTGTVSSFTNSGTIGSNTLQFSPVSLSAAPGSSFSFTNSGSIVGPNSANFFITPSVSIGDSNSGTALRSSATVSNSGSIASGVFGGLTANTLTFTNSGTINGISTPFNGGSIAVNFYAYASTGSLSAPSTGSSASFTNSANGTLNGFVSFTTTAATLNLTNAGAINGTFSGAQNAVSVYVPAANGLSGTYVTPDQLTSTFSNSGTVTSSSSYVTAAASLAASAATVTATNSGTIGAQGTQAGALLVLDQTSGSNAVTVTNSGSLTASGSGGSGLLVASTVAQTTPASTAQAAVTITNTGTISATGGAAYSPGFNLPYYATPSQLSLATGVAVGASAQGGTSVSITNAKGASIIASGSTSQSAQATVAIPAPYDKAGAVGLIAAGDTVTIANSGTITGGPDIPTDTNTVAYVSGVALPLSGTISGGIQVYAATAMLTNNAGGVINGSVGLATTTAANVTNYGAINGNVTLGTGTNTFLEGIGATVSGTVDGSAGASALTIDLTGGGQLDTQLSHFAGFSSPHLIGSGTVTANAPLAADTLVLDNATLTIAAGSTLQTAGPVTLTGGAGSSTITNYGTIAGKVVLGPGNDSFLEGINAGTGAVDGGAGTNSLTVDVTGGGSLTQAVAPFSNFQSLAVTGNGTISVTAPLAASTLVLNGATLTLASGSTLQTGSSVALTGGTGTNAFTNNGTVNGAIVGVDTVNGAGGTVNIIASATDNANFTNAAADATLAVNAGTLTLGQKLANSGLVAVSGGATLTDRAGIANLAGGRITVASGGTINDALDNAGTVVNSGTYNADLNNLAGGSATNAAGATWTGALTNAAGATLVNQGALVGTVANAGSFTNATGASVSGALTQTAGATTNAGALNGGAVINGGSLTSSGTINGLTNAGSVSITGGTLAGTVSNSGTLNFANGVTVSGQLTNRTGGQIVGTLAFGAGNDTLTLMSGAGVTGAIDGGAGTNTLVLASAGTDAAPDEYNLTKLTNFQQTTQTSGTIAVSGTYTTNQLDVLAGRYIGRTGSVLNASTVNVAAGATFGSGGIVNGNVNVKGTLAPGGTVGTMAVNGNVAFASGSTALFDVGQATSDQLAVSGTVNIASGTTLTLAAVQNNPLKPGSSIDLIVASGGITGSFGTIVKPASILGFVVQRATKISLLGQFLADSTFSPPATAAVNYVNAILTGGQASGALLNAIPSLLTAGGNTNAASFAQLTPEAYASATQIGTDNGLAIAAAMRSMDVSHAPASGNLFVFGQGLGVWSRLNGDAALGTSRATQNGGGVLGGVGFGSGSASITGFVGYTNGHQTIDALGARTRADGTFVGASAHLANGGFSGTVTFAYDMSTADTTRPVPGGTREEARYRLRSTTFDVDIGYDLALGTSLALRPEVGFTSVRTKRGTAIETGSAGAFDFTVARDAHSANFVDGGVRLETLPASTATVRPWLDLGVRHLFDADARFATAYLAGGPSGITVAGVGRARTVATVGAGFDAAVAHNVTLFAGYDGAFGKGTSGNKVNGGIRVSF